MIGISLLTGELVFTALWLLCRGIIWIRQKKIVWKREAALLLMYVNLAVLLRFVLYPFFTVNGQVQPLIINTRSIQPVRDHQHAQHSAGPDQLDPVCKTLRL